jgi:glycosyltransferase involved in cell wall biosynthesis
VKIWYDVSDVMAWNIPHLTGIQRTLVGILNGLKESDAQVALVRYDARAGRFRPIEESELPPAIRRHLGPTAAAPVASGEDAAAPAAAPRRRRKLRLRLSLRKFIGSDRRAEELRAALKSFRQASRQLRTATARWAFGKLPGAGREATTAVPPEAMRHAAPRIDASDAATAFASAGDVFLSVGASWGLPGHTESTDLLRSRGVRVVRMIYDLIPTLRSQWLEPEHTRIITLWAREVLTASDVVLTISEFSRQEIIRYCQECRFEAPPVSVVRLGDVMGGTVEERPQAALPRFVPSRPFFLCVSTLDVRKNHRLLYDAWTHLAARRGEDCPDLVCIGLPHLHVTDLLREIRQDRAVNRSIHILHGIEDSELAWYYSRCAATIYPSRYEGWGLPVAESLGHGRMCLASNATSIPEISDLPEFFDPYDVHGVVALVERVLDDPAWVRHREETIRARFKPTAWHETAAQVLAAAAEAPGVRLRVWTGHDAEAAIPDPAVEHTPSTRASRAA